MCKPFCSFQITSLFDVSYFGNLAAEELEAKKSILKNVYTSYCGLLPGLIFINILRVPFMPIFLSQKITKP